MSNSWLVLIETKLQLKEQYPVSAHAPNFDFWTGCREIKRCGESKRTLKNPFASRLAGSNTTLKHFRITDQWYFVTVKFLFGQKLDFFGVFLLPLAGGPKDWKHFDADWRLISSASFHTSSDNCERNTEKRKKQMTLARAHNRDTVPLSLYTKLERRNPCSKPPTVYVDLSTRNDWTVKITTVDLPMEIRNAFSIIRRDLLEPIFILWPFKVKTVKKEGKKREFEPVLLIYSNIFGWPYQPSSYYKEENTTKCYKKGTVIFRELL